MKIIENNIIKKAEATTCIKQNISHLDLINRAADAFVKKFQKIFTLIPQKVQILCGNGNNGADGLLIANGLATIGFDVQVVLIEVSTYPTEEFLAAKKLLFQSVSFTSLTNSHLDDIKLIHNGIIIDGLIGAGLSRPLDEKMAVFIDGINSVDSVKVAIDLPTGMHADEGVIGPAIKCDYTLGLGSAKMGYFLEGSSLFTGKLSILDIGLESPDNPDDTASDMFLTPNNIRSMFAPIAHTLHKYQRGHCFLTGGSYGMTGCMRLAGEAALRTGCGIVTLHVPGYAVNFLQASLPEAIIQADTLSDQVSDVLLPPKYNAYCIGPGMGTAPSQADLIRKFIDSKPEKPGVWDADALNILANNSHLLELLPPGAVLTPHTGEFERLFGPSQNPVEQLNTLRTNAVKYKCHIVLKRPYTMIATPSGQVCVNSTGHWGMATAGSGDVLSGMIASILAQGYSPFESSAMGVFLHGMAGEIAAERYSPFSMIASDIINCIGSAYLSILKKHT